MPLETVNDVLDAIKNKKFCIADTVKNRKTRTNLGITVDDQIDLIKSLTVTDCISGPEMDYDGSPGNIWKFKKRKFGETFYIKIKYMDPIVVISCHIDNIDI